MRLLSHDKPEICSCSALRQAARHVTRAYDEALKPVGLGLNQYAIFAKIERHGPQGLQALADRLVMDRSTLGHLLRPLERRGLVAIQVALGDRRGRTIALTPAGSALLARARVLWADAERRFKRAFGAEEATRFHGMLTRAARTDLSQHDTPPQETA